MSQNHDAKATIKAAWISGIFVLIAAIIGGIFMVLSQDEGVKNGFSRLFGSSNILGDEISYFRVIDIEGSSVTIEADYSFNEIHGEKVLIGGCFYFEGRMIGGCGYKPVYLDSNEGSATISIHPKIDTPHEIDEVRIFLYEFGKNAFTEESFEFKNTIYPDTD